MPEIPAKKTFDPSGSIEFEFTDVATARQQADQPPVLSALEQLLPGNWEKQRRAASPTDRALTGKAIDWLLSLPAAVRPKALGEQYPRIANHLAGHWHDLGGTQFSLMRLLADERGGRRGFSLQIEQEIGRLAAHVQSLLDEMPTEPAAL